MNSLCRKALAVPERGLEGLPERVIPSRGFRRLRRRHEGDGAGRRRISPREAGAPTRAHVSQCSENARGAQASSPADVTASRAVTLLIGNADVILAMRDPTPSRLNG